MFNKSDVDGTTPLTLAFKNKQSSFVTFILLLSSSGFRIPKDLTPIRNQVLKLDMTTCSKKYGTPLNLAIHNHDFKVAKLLLISTLRNNDALVFDINAID